MSQLRGPAGLAPAKEGKAQMSEAAILQLISTGGAAVVLFWVVAQFVGGKIHSESEVEGLRKRIEALTAINDRYAIQFDKVNEILEKAVERGYNAAGRSR